MNSGALPSLFSHLHAVSTRCGQHSMHLTSSRQLWFVFLSHWNYQSQLLSFEDLNPWTLWGLVMLTNHPRGWSGQKPDRPRTETQTLPTLFTWLCKHIFVRCLHGDECIWLLLKHNKWEPEGFWFMRTFSELSSLSWPTLYQILPPLLPFLAQVHTNEAALRVTDLKHTTRPVQRDTALQLSKDLYECAHNSRTGVWHGICSVLPERPEVFVCSGQVQSSLDEQRAEGGLIRCLFYLGLCRLSVRCPGAA